MYLFCANPTLNFIVQKPLFCAGQKTIYHSASRIIDLIKAYARKEERTVTEIWENIRWLGKEKWKYNNDAHYWVDGTRVSVGYTNWKNGQNTLARHQYTTPNTKSLFYLPLMVRMFLRHTAFISKGSLIANIAKYIYNKLFISIYK